MLAIIPARGGSKRIPKKNIVDFCGKPLMSYAINCLKDSNLFSKIHVSTDDQEIWNVAKNFGCEPDFFRSDELADDKTGVVPVLRWVVEKYESMGHKFSDICFAMPTAPLILPEDITAAFEIYRKNGKNCCVLTVGRYPVPIEWAFTMDPEHRLKSVSPGKSNEPSQSFIKKYFDAGAFAFLSKDLLMNKDVNLTEHFLGYELPRNRVVDIDEPDDLLLAESLYLGYHQNLKNGVRR